MQPQSESQVEANNESNAVRTLISFYSNYLWNRLTTFFPFSPSNILGKMSILYRQTSSKRRPTLNLPLPLPSYSSDSSVYVLLFISFSLFTWINKVTFCHFKILIPLQSSLKCVSVLILLFWIDDECSKKRKKDLILKFLNLVVFSWCTLYSIVREGKKNQSLKYIGGWRKRNQSGGLFL